MDNQVSTAALVVIAASGGIGGLVAGLVSALVNWRTEESRRDHERSSWLRDKKLAAYSEFAASARVMDASFAVPNKNSDVVKENLFKFNQRYYDVQLLMEEPRLSDFVESRRALGRASGSEPYDREEANKALAAMNRLMREDLRET